MNAVAAVPTRPAGMRASDLTVPSDLAATEPPEARGLARDEVRLMVAGDGPLRHTLFRDLPAFLAAGDLLVVNTSATLPAAVDGRRDDGRDVKVHFATYLGGDGWIVELRRAGVGRVRDGRVGEQIQLPNGVVARLTASYPDPARRRDSRLWNATIAIGGDALAYLGAVGRPITYEYLRGQWPLVSYQTIFATEPGSAEMPSAGRPFSTELLAALAASGVLVAPVTLHTGVSSLEAGERPLPERYRVPDVTARAVAATRAAGGRVVAVGTTATRALETVASTDGAIVAGEGWTDVVLGPDHPARVVDGIITGWHDPDGSHLLLLEAVVGEDLVASAYRAALAERYRWHEFGDSCLLLRPRR